MSSPVIIAKPFRIFTLYTNKNFVHLQYQTHKATSSSAIQPNATYILHTSAISLLPSTASLHPIGPTSPTTSVLQTSQGSSRLVRARHGSSRLQLVAEGVQLQELSLVGAAHEFISGFRKRDIDFRVKFNMFPICSYMFQYVSICVNICFNNLCSSCSLEIDEKKR